MEISRWYAVSLGALVALLLIYRLVLVAVSAIPKLLRGEDTITRLHSLLIFLYICGNLLCVLFRTTSTSQVGTRLGLISLVNLIPLCTGGRMNLVANSCGLSHENYSRMHRWIGRVAVIQGLTHGAISLAEMKSESTPVQLPGLLAAGGMLLLLLLSFFFIRRLFYEIFLKLHLLFTVVTLVTLWYHFSSRRMRVYLIVAICVLGTTFVLRISLSAYRNFAHGRFAGSAVTKQLHDAIQINLKVRRPWKLQAGQYIYLYALEVSFWAWVQSHPFVVAWWHRDAQGDITVTFLIQPRRGFTKTLQNTSTSVRAFVEGPYGSEKNLGSYGTVIMFATGIGIAGQLLYIQDLLEGHDQRKVTTQRISLYWQLEKECHEEWVSQWMNELLQQDKHRILNISLYVLGKHRNPVRYGNGLKKWYKPFDVGQLVRDEVKELEQKGRILVSVCADSNTKDIIRKVVGEILTKDIRVEELDFHPATLVPCEGGA